MKKAIVLSLMAIMALALSSCASKSYSSGKEDVSFIMVLKESSYYRNVIVVVDSIEYRYKNVRYVQNKVNARTIAITPGKHNIKVIAGGRVVKDEMVFIGVQETKTLILR